MLLQGIERMISEEDLEEGQSHSPQCAHDMVHVRDKLSQMKDDGSNKCFLLFIMYI